MQGLMADECPEGMLSLLHDLQPLVILASINVYCKCTVMAPWMTCEQQSPKSLLLIGTIIYRLDNLLNASHGNQRAFAAVQILLRQSAHAITLTAIGCLAAEAALQQELRAALDLLLCSTDLLEWHSVQKLIKSLPKVSKNASWQLFTAGVFKGQYLFHQGAPAKLPEIHQQLSSILCEAALILVSLVCGLHWRKA